MRIADIIEAKAPEKLCKSRIPDDQLGASQLASCKSQGLRARDSGDSYTIGGKKVKLRGKTAPISQTTPVVPLTTFENCGDSPLSSAPDDQSFADIGETIAISPVTKL